MATVIEKARASARARAKAAPRFFAQRVPPLARRDLIETTEKQLRSEDDAETKPRWRVVDARTALTVDDHLGAAEAFRRAAELSAKHRTAR